jgi:O-acetyl-ADP-ribose deacetylase (regulator of RNase III)
MTMFEARQGDLADLAVDAVVREAASEDDDGSTARSVILVQGPTWQGGRAQDDLALADTYGNGLAEAARLGCRSVAFLPISVGTDGFPRERAAAIAVAALRKAAHRLDSIERVVFACPDAESVQLHRQALEMPY